MSMKRFAFVTLFIAQTPIDEGGKVKNSGFYTGMIKAMFDRIVDSNKPFPRTGHCKNLQD